MSKDMLVSVIVPCYNAENFITATINSVLEQKHQNTEIICVNDGSSDNTGGILDDLRQKLDKKIQVYHQANGGPGKARNTGLNYAKGEYIQFLDADDILKKDKIRHQVQLIHDLDYDPDMIAAAVEKHFEDGRIKIAKNEVLEPWIGLAKYKIGITSSNLWKKSSLEAVNGFDENLPSNEEHDLIFRMLKNKAKVLYDVEPLTIKKERSSGSISSSSDHIHLKRKVLHRSAIYQFTKEHGLLDQCMLEYLLTEIIKDLKNIREKDELMAFQLFNEYVPDGFILKGEFSKSYLTIYNTLGFRKAEILRKYLGK